MRVSTTRAQNPGCVIMHLLSETCVLLLLLLSVFFLSLSLPLTDRARKTVPDSPSNEPQFCIVRNQPDRQLCNQVCSVLCVHLPGSFGVRYAARLIWAWLIGSRGYLESPAVANFDAASRPTSGRSALAACWPLDRHFLNDLVRRPATLSRAFRQRPVASGLCSQLRCELCCSQL